MDLPVTLSDFEAAAEQALDPGAYGYYAGGAGDEITLRENVEAWRRIALRPRMMVDVSHRDPSTSLLGRERPHPFVVAPTAFHRGAHPEGEEASARAAAATEAIYCLSSLATTGPAQLAAAVPEVPRWFQLYVFRDRGVTREIVAGVREHGYEALVVTVDLPVFGARERDLRSGWTIGDATGAPNVGAAGGQGALTPAQVGELVDPSLTWHDIGEFASESGLPVLVKGVLTPEDARRAVDHGAAGVVVSNHGGRQLDTVLGGADALPAIADEVATEVDVLVDGGVRRGTDAIKALAHGARAVMVGRPLLWGLAVGGAQGAQRVLELLLGEFDTALALTGCPRARDLDRSYVQRAPWAG